MPRLRSLLLATALALTTMSSGAGAEESTVGTKFDGTYVGTYDCIGSCWTHRKETIVVKDGKFMFYGRTLNKYTEISIQNNGDFSINTEYSNGSGHVSNGIFEESVRNISGDVYRFRLNLVN